MSKPAGLGIGVVVHYVESVDDQPFNATGVPPRWHQGDHVAAMVVAVPGPLPMDPGKPADPGHPDRDPGLANLRVFYDSAASGYYANVPYSATLETGTWHFPETV